MAKSLAAAAGTAKKSGLSNSTGPSKVTQHCSAGTQKNAANPGKGDYKPSDKYKDEHQYEPCVLQQLLIELNDNSRAESIQLSAQRRDEPVQPTVATEYKGSLRSYDLVVEALSAIDVGQKGNHLRVKAQSFNTSRHVSFQPMHPRTEVGWEAAADNGGMVTTKIPTPHRDNVQSWLSIWPFSEQRTVYAPINGIACGHDKLASDSAPAPLRSLAVHLVVLPHEEWTFSIEGTKSYSKSKKVTGDIKRQGEKGSDVWASKTVTSKTERGDASDTASTTTNSSKQYKSTSETQVNADGSSSAYQSEVKGDGYNKQSLSTVDAEGRGESITETHKGGEYSEKVELSEQKDTVIPIASHTYSVSTTESTDKGKGPASDKARYKVSDIFSLEVKSGGGSRQVRAECARRQSLRYCRNHKRYRENLQHGQSRLELLLRLQPVSRRAESWLGFALAKWISGKQSRLLC